MDPLKVATKALSLKRLPLPERPRIVDIRVEKYVDHLGDDAFNIWCIMDESTTDEDMVTGSAAKLRFDIGRLLLKAGINWFPYVHFVKESDLKAAELSV